MLSIDIVDIKPVNMEELTEVITATEFHPSHCNLFMYSSSKSNIKLADMRDSALCDQQSKCMLHEAICCFMLFSYRILATGFEEEEDPSTRSFFSEIISSISDVKFSHDGRYILSRDYLSLKIWDVNMESRPVKTIPIHDHLRGKLCDLYENDCIFDKFECVWGGDDKYVYLSRFCYVNVISCCRHVLTGSYHNYFRIYDSDTLNDVVLQADKSAFKAKKIGGPLPGGRQTGLKNGQRGLRDAMQLDTLDFNKKILHASWHPRENTIAVSRSMSYPAL
jgi:serine/threonine-protein phosphatase 2A regulatory subunit B